MRMPRFLIVLHHDVLINDCTREPFDSSSSTPSVTRNSTSCGLSPLALVPLPGVGMIALIVFIAVSQFVSVSPEVQAWVRQLFEYTCSNPILLAAAFVVLIVVVSVWIVLT